MSDFGDAFENPLPTNVAALFGDGYQAPVVLDLVEIAENEVAAVRRGVEIVAALHFHFEESRSAGRDDALRRQALLRHAISNRLDLTCVGTGHRGAVFGGNPADAETAGDADQNLLPKVGHNGCSCAVEGSATQPRGWCSACSSCKRWRAT